MSSFVKSLASATVPNRQLARKLGDIPEATQQRIHQLSLEPLDVLGDLLFELDTVDDLMTWLSTED